nr:LamG-like jellyroll fold domain-containing protein [Paenibacillus mangrovi]
MVFTMFSTGAYAATDTAEANSNLIASIKFDGNLKDDVTQQDLIAKGNHSFVDGLLPGTKALHLESGNGNYISTPQSLKFGEESFTVSFWYKGDTKNNNVILSNKDYSNGANAGWAIYTSANSINMNFGFPTAKVKDISFGRNTFNASDWRYVTFVVDRDKMVGTLYIDAYKMAETSLRHGSLDTSNPLIIGGDGLGNKGGNTFDIADLMISKDVLSTDDVQANYNSYAGHEVDMNALNDAISQANTIVAGGLGDGFSQTDFDYLKKVLDYANTVATTQKVKFYTQETINYYVRELNNAIFIYQKSNKTLTPAELNMTVHSDPEITGTVESKEHQKSDLREDMSVFPQSDVIVMPGDITGGNNPSEYVWMGNMADAVDELKDEGVLDNTLLYMVKGNHDMNGSEKLIPVGSAGAWNDSTQSYENHFYNSAYRVKIKGFNLIGFDGNINSSDTVGKATDFLNEIKSEPDYDPKKPIFAMSHYPISGTVWSERWSSAASNAFGKFLNENDFSQVFYMSGHTQYDPTDERSLYQGSATFMDAGAASYSSYIDDGPYGGYIEGAYINYKTTPRIVNFLEVYGSKIIIKHYNLATHEFVGTPSVVNVGDGKDAFTYSRSDTKELIAPQFDEGIKVDSVKSGEVEFTIKQSNDNVRNLEYNVQLINKLTGEVDKAFNSLSLPLDKPYDEYRQYKITGLLPKTPYLLRVFAADDMYNRSYQDIEFTTGDARLSSITAPAAVSASNGSPKTATGLGLPLKVTLVTDDGGNVDGSVNWDLSDVSYDPAIKTVQTFSVPGTVTLPSGVDNPNSVPLTTSINVTVLAAGDRSISLDKTQYLKGEPITLSYAGAASNGYDWAGVYSAGVKPGDTYSLTWDYMRPGDGRLSLGNSLAPGTYDIHFLLDGGYTSVDKKTFEVVESVTLQSITQPAAIQGLESGTAKTAEALGLPSTVELVTGGGSKNANVTWNVDAANYDPAQKIEQTFTVDGTVTLPAGVANPNHVDLAVTISVTVNAAEAVDQQPPTTTDNAPSGWVNQDVTVTLSAIDNESGVANTYYTVDDGAEQTGTTVVLSDEGDHKLVYWSVDRAGNVEERRTAAIMIDKTAPAIVVSVPEDGSIYEDSGDLTPQITMTDNLSGVDNGKTTVTLDTNSYRLGTAIPLYTLPLGQHTLVVSSSDLAGNQGSKTVQFQTVASINSLKALVTRFANNNGIDNADITKSLLGKLANNNLKDFMNLVKAQSGKHISSEAAKYLLRDAQYVLSQK